jgi:hypothetical protein
MLRPPLYIDIVNINLTGHIANGIRTAPHLLYDLKKARKSVIENANSHLSSLIMCIITYLYERNDEATMYVQRVLFCNFSVITQEQSVQFLIVLIE